jgi:DNA-binding FadR family transcriptional regulator
VYAEQVYHFQLHMRIAESTGCRALVKLIEQTHVLMFNWVWDLAAKRPALPPRFHRDLIDVLVETNPRNSDAAMRRHIRYGLKGIIRAIEASADPVVG